MFVWQRLLVIGPNQYTTQPTSEFLALREQGIHITFAERSKYYSISSVFTES